MAAPMKPDEVFTESLWEDLTKDMDLSPQLKRIALHLLYGLDDKRIAQTMKITVSTVRSHLARLYGALQVDDRCGVMIFLLCRMRERCGG